MSNTIPETKIGPNYNRLSDNRRKNQYAEYSPEERKIQEEIDDRNFPLNHGLYLTKDMEDLPVFGPKGDVEVVMARKSTGKGPSGARIVLTKDNCGSRGTGYGGSGGTMCEAIDIVAGSLTCEGRLMNSKTLSRGNFISDGARIYLTERGNIQKYFGLRQGSSDVSMSSQGKSAIAMKSDHTIVMGRERVRVLVGLANAEGGERMANQQKPSAPKIELARANSEDSQPGVLGDALVDYLKKIRNEIRDLRQIHMDLEKKVMEYTIAMATHTHTGFGLGVVQCIPSFEAIGEIPESVSTFFATQTEVLVDNYNSKVDEMKASGPDSKALQGSIKERICSTTVYIGK